MPMTLWHALDHLEIDEVLRDGLGKTPDGDYLDYFVDDKARRGACLPRRGDALGARPLPAGFLTAGAAPTAPLANQTEKETTHDPPNRHEETTP